MLRVRRVIDISAAASATEFFVTPSRCVDMALISFTPRWRALLMAQNNMPP